MFRRVQVDIPSFEAGVSAEPAFETRYVLGWEAVSWNLLPKHNASTGLPTPVQRHSLYIQASCSATAIVSCEDTDFSSAFLFVENLHNTAAFLRPGFRWFSGIMVDKETLKASNLMAPTLQVRATEKCAEITSVALLGKEGYAITFAAPTMSSSDITTQTAEQESRRQLWTEDESCMTMRVDDTRDVNTCGSVNKGGVWVDGRVTVYEDRRKGAAILVPLVDERLFLA